MSLLYNKKEGNDMFGISDKVVIGYDLSNKYAQISFCRLNDDMPETITLLEGAEQYDIPTCLFKRSEVNQWFFGKEALSYSKLEEGTIIDNLLEQALIGDEIAVSDEYFNPIALLALYIKRSLSLVRNNVHTERICGIMFTVPDLTKRAIEVLNQVSVLLDLNDVTIQFQSREESIYRYIIHQASELWQYDVEVYDFSLDSMRSYHFYENKHTDPKVVFIDETLHKLNIRSDLEERDAAFLVIAKETTDERIVSCAYLIGDGFNGEWCKVSLRELCKKRRAFRGNNLYSKGACYSIRDKLIKKEIPDKRIYLGRDKLKANIGMNVFRKGEKSYLALLNGGDSWYESKKECDIILCSGNRFSVIITPLDGRNIKTIEVELDGLPIREDRTTRLRINVFMESEDILHITATDMGFGEIVPSTNQVFTQQINLYE